MSRDPAIPEPPKGRAPHQRPGSTASAALAVRDLRVRYRGEPPTTALDGVDLTVAEGTAVGLIGESGSGKTTLSRAAAGLLTDSEADGRVTVAGRDMTSADEATWRAVRWRDVALVPQSTAALTPTLTVGAQLAEPLRHHHGATRRHARKEAARALARVGLDPDLASTRPSQLSGGQRRLVMLAMAMVTDPALIVLDEPTVGLDPATRGRVLALLRDLRDAGTALLVATHDLRALGDIADRVTVLYRGWVAEEGPASLLDGPQHPYTAGLVRATPTLGDVKDLRPLPAARADAPAGGCPFADRCSQATAACGLERPRLAPVGHPAEIAHAAPGHAAPGDANARGHVVACVQGGVRTVLSARALSRTYLRSAGTGRRQPITALGGVDVTIRHGEVVGLVGASGAGKSTLVSVLAGLEPPDGGEVWLDGEPLSRLRGRERRHWHARIQLVQQDAVEAFSPRRTIGASVAEPLEAQGVGTSASRAAAAAEALAEARLDKALAARFPGEVSGGQLQRAALARALVLDPDVLIADESLSMLDPSEQAGMLDALKSLQVRHGMAVVLTSHDLGVVLRLADRVVVLDGGRVVEEASGAQLLRSPAHRVTRELLAASGHAPALLPTPTGRVATPPPAATPADAPSRDPRPAATPTAPQELAAVASGDGHTARLPDEVTDARDQEPTR